MGPDLMAKMQEQAEKFGTEVVYDDVVKLELTGDVEKIVLGSGAEHEAESVIFATGSAPRRSVSRASRDCPVTECRIARRATASSSASRPSLSSAAATPRWRKRPSSRNSPRRCTSSTVARSCAPPRSCRSEPSRTRRSSSCGTARSSTVLGGDAVSGLLLRDTVDGTERELAVTGVFVAIGNDPRTHLVHDSLRLTSTAPSGWTAAPRAPRCPGSSPPVMWSTRSIARRSRLPAVVPPPPSTSSTTSPPAAMPELLRRMPPRSTASKTPPDRAVRAESGTSRHPPAFHTPEPKEPRLTTRGDRHDRQGHEREHLAAGRHRR